MTTSWWSYNEITYTLEQILFLLSHMDLLESGRWPPEHKGGGYTGSSKGRAYKHEGSFVKPVIIMAELTLRLDATGLDGKMVIERYAEDFDEMALAKRYKTDYWEVVARVNSALNYCQGMDRKWISYQSWKISNGTYT